ncbi:hypothetical protein BJ912DRAFT_602358 [Pholiota molesta]|nr:hypothetical protein BJ912DRAFT_602358 [Pholiota molesta]
MASGFSWGGGRSRCFSYWQEFQKCYAQTDHPSECAPQRQDYLECLHHSKQNQRNSAVLAEYTRKAEQLAKEQQHRDKAAAGGGTHSASPVKSGDKPEETPPPAK